MGDISASDVLAMTRNDDGFLNGNSLIILILFFLIFGMGGNGFGRNNAMENALTRAEVQDVISTQNIGNSINSLAQSVNTGFSNVLMNENNGINSVNSNIADLRYAMQDCCCQIKNTITTDGNQTRALIQENTIQALRDEINAKDRELLSTGLVTAQTIQTNNLENFIRNAINGCGCGC